MPALRKIVPVAAAATGMAIVFTESVVTEPYKQATLLALGSSTVIFTALWN